MFYRSTFLRLGLERCPGAMDLYEQGVPYERGQFQAGIAAHACLQACIDHPDRLPVGLCESVVRTLVTEGRSFYGSTEPPMTVEAACAGRDLALSWLARDAEGLGAGWRAEVPLSVDADWKPCATSAAWLHAAIDVIGPDRYEDDEMEADGVLVRDWKSAWGTDIGDLDSLQQEIQTVLAVAHHPGAAFVRREVVNLRTGHVHSERLWLDEDGQARIAAMRARILHAVAQADARGPDGRRPFRPGAGCGGCPYVLRCPAAREAIPADLSATDLSGADPLALAQQYAILSALLDAMRPILRAAAQEGDLVVSGGAVGYRPQQRRESSPGAPGALCRAWFAPADADAWEREHASTLGLLAALSPGASGIEAVGKVLWPGRGAGKIADFRDRREALEAACLDTRTSPVFGVTKGA